MPRVIDRLTQRENDAARWGISGQNSAATLHRAFFSANFEIPRSCVKQDDFTAQSIAAGVRIGVRAMRNTVWHRSRLVVLHACREYERRQGSIHDAKVILLALSGRRDDATVTSLGYGDATSKSSRVLRELRRDIVSGRLEAGRKLSFGFLTQTYGVGISPLREALCLLVGKGLVMLESQRGFRVAPVSAQDLADVIATRGHIETYALGLSIERGDDHWRRQLEEATARFTTVAAKVGDQRPIDEDWQIIHRRYHFALIGACDSPTVLDFCKQIYDRFDRYRRLAVPSQSFMAGPARDHREIMHAALAGRREHAQAMLARHIADIAEVVAANFPPKGP